MRAVVVGVGAVGARAARQLLGSVDDLLLVDSDGPRAEVVATSLGPPAEALSPEAALARRPDVALLALPSGHREAAERFLESGCDVVSVADSVEEVRALLDLDSEARERDRHVVVGAGFSPGLTCVLARHAAAGFDRVDEVHVAKFGTGGPACARRHHAALAGEALDWRDGAWARRRAGSGRELCWFPDPVGSVDCYRAALADALVLVPAFPGAVRVTARMGANRRDRLTARFPMLRPPHAEAGAGAVRVEVRGWRGSTSDTRVMGAMDRPSVAAGAVAALATSWALNGDLSRSGAAGLAELVAPVQFLAELANRGVKAAVFEGAAIG